MLHLFTTLVILLLVTKSALAKENSLISCLQAAVPQLTLPTEANFTALKRVYNTRFDSNEPLAIASVSSESEIQRLLNCTRPAGVTPVARSGGHSFEGYSTLNGSVVIDLRPYMKKVTIDSKRFEMKVQAGANNGEIFFHAWNKGFGFNGGSFPTVGISGLALGGGYGFLARREGMLVEKIKEIRMINAKGSVVIANATRNPDLFWALRGGGGGNFGIVTEWTIKLAHIPEVVEYTDLLFPLELALDQWHWFQSNAEALDPAIAMNFKPVTGKTSGLYNIRYIPDPMKGPIIPLKEQIQRLNLPGYADGLFTETITTMNFIDAVMWNGDGWNVSEPTDLLNLESNASGKRDSNYTEGGFQVHAYGGAIADVADDATAFPHRQGIIGLIQAIARWNSPEEEALAVNYLHTFQDIITAEQPHRGYVNYLDDHPGGDWREVYYGENYERLVELKNKYGPPNLFRNPQSIGTPREAEKR